MPKLTEEMKTFIEKERNPSMAFVGTSSKEGVPNVVAKGTFIKVLDDETLVYADVYSDKTLKNVSENPQVTMAVINISTFKGYQFKGSGEVVDSGPILEEARDQNPQVKSVTKINVQEVYLLDYGPGAGKKVI